MKYTYFYLHTFVVYHPSVFQNNCTNDRIAFTVKKGHQHLVEVLAHAKSPILSFLTPTDGLIRASFLPCLYFAPSSPRHYFFASIVILFIPRRQTNERTSKRTNER
jgi:hypothetical protein